MLLTFPPCRSGKRVKEIKNSFKVISKLVTTHVPHGTSAYRAISNGVEINWLAVIGRTVPDDFESVGVSGCDDWQVTFFEVFLFELIENLRGFGDGTWGCSLDSNRRPLAQSNLVSGGKSVERVTWSASRLTRNAFRIFTWTCRWSAVEAPQPHKACRESRYDWLRGISSMSYTETMICRIVGTHLHKASRDSFLLCTGRWRP